MKRFALKSLVKTLIWIGIPSVIFTIIYFKWIGKDLVDYSHMLTALVAIISLFLFSISVLIKKQQYTVNFISQVYKDEMAKVFSKLRTAFADEKFDLSQAEIKIF